MSNNETNNLYAKRYTAYLGKEATDLLLSFKEKTGMKTSNIIAGLCRLLAVGKLDNKYKVLYDEVRKSFYYEESKLALGNIENIIERVNQNLPTKFTKKEVQTWDTLTNSVFWCSDCNKYCVVVALSTTNDLSKLIGDLYLFKANSGFEKIVVVIPHLYHNMERHIIDMLCLSDIYISSTLNLESCLVGFYN